MNTVESIRRALDGNPNAQIGGVLLERRVLTTDHGRISHEGAPELLALLDNRFDTYWYGHVFLRDPDDPETGTWDQPPWVSLIVNSSENVDGSTADHVFRNLHRALVLAGQYEPSYCREPDEIVRLASSFEEACRNLADMVSTFDPLLAFGPVDLDYGRFSDHHPEAMTGKLTVEMSCLLYGTDFLTPTELALRGPEPW